MSATPMMRVFVCIATTAAVVVAVAPIASGTSGAAGCRPTANDGAGPFQRLDAPRRAKIGTGHVLTGRVLRATDCAPVAGALVYLWQAGPNGYGPRGRGSVLTGRAGGFRFEGPVPASYGRAPHIHLAVVHPDYEELLTRYVVRPGAKTGKIRLVLTPFL